MNTPILHKHNSLVALDTGVWVKADESERSFIDYTDGSSTEEKVYAQVKAAEDRSVYSDELDQAWEDWALEYHLGSKRSNIYRGLNLDHVGDVLEVGCGCGAITRFLGEQGFQVDAIEGTLRRAEIARLRTADLEKVQIVSSNYHELELSGNSYDLVVFTGVLEYSGAYAEQGVSPEAQLELTLRHARAALKPGGQILIAIENRTGFKYLAGASEDHLNVPNIGLLDYPEPLSGEITRGIRTWSKRQWHEMLQAFGFANYEFCYPFPDYKVPDAIISDHFLMMNKHPEQVLGGIASRDYFATWQPRLGESLFWRTAAQTGSLDEFSNSFLIVLGDSMEGVRQTIDFDFVRFASMMRKPKYRMQVLKKRDEDVVRREPLTASAAGAPADGVLAQYHIQGERFVDGQVLEDLWRQALTVVPDYDELAAHLRRYCDWLDDVLVDGADKFVDALPRNIIVDNEGQWHLIDQEWHAPDGISKETIVFRVLFYFALNARDTLAEVEFSAERKAAGMGAAACELPLVQSINDFVAWGFELVGLDYEAHRDACLAFETGVQQQVSRFGSEIKLKDVLYAPIGRWQVGRAFEFAKRKMEVRVFWTQMDKVWHLDHSVASELAFEHGLHASVPLPEMACTHRYVRIDPAAYVLYDYQCWLTFHCLSIVVTRHSGEQQTVYSIDSAEALFQRARLKGFRQLVDQRILLVSAHANIVLDLKEVEWGEDIASIELSLELDMCQDEQQAHDRQILREESRRAGSRLKVLRHILDRQQQRIEVAAERLESLQQQLEHDSTTSMGKLLARFGLMRKR